MAERLPPAAPGDPFAYDRFVGDALRGVIRRALETAMEHGLVGRHALYITLRTAAEGVELPGYLRARHPDEITIVLEHKFSDLVVEDDGFGVTLSFGGVPARLRVPYRAVLRFADPEAQFGLDFAPPVVSGEDSATPDGRKPDEKSGEQTTPASDNVVALDRFRKS